MAKIRASNTRRTVVMHSNNKYQLKERILLEKFEIIPLMQLLIRRNK